jgi:hypothetical protein
LQEFRGRSSFFNLFSDDHLLFGMVFCEIVLVLRLKGSPEMVHTLSEVEKVHARVPL